jgi:hypothetical protein
MAPSAQRVGAAGRRAASLSWKRRYKILSAFADRGDTCIPRGVGAGHSSPSRRSWQKRGCPPGNGPSAALDTQAGDRGRPSAPSRAKARPQRRRAAATSMKACPTRQIGSPHRLKQVDMDGRAGYSKEVTVGREVTEAELLGTYPNPATRTRSGCPSTPLRARRPTLCSSTRFSPQR